MNKVAQYYRELVASLSERLRNGERDIDALVEQARERVIKTGELTRTEVDELTRAVRRDLEEFAMSYEESLKEESDSVFMRVIKESLWQELADITDKTQLEWREVFQDLNHHGGYHSGEVVGLGNLVASLSERLRNGERDLREMSLPSPDLHTGSADAMPEMWS